MIFSKRMTPKEGRSLRPDHFHADKAVRCRRQSGERTCVRVCACMYACVHVRWCVWVTVVNIRQIWRRRRHTLELPYRVSPAATVARAKIRILYAPKAREKPEACAGTVVGACEWWWGRHMHDERGEFVEVRGLVRSMSMPKLYFHAPARQFFSYSIL